MLGNAAVTAVLALFALAVGYTCRSPAVRHAAWLLVLLKLVTPPLISIPVFTLPASWAEPHTDPTRPSLLVTLFVPAPIESGRAVAGGKATSLTWWDRCRSIGVADCVFGVWAAGTIGWFVWQCRRIVRFRRRLRGVEDVGADVAEAAARIATALGLARPPVVKVATGIGSPMLWGVGRGTVVLFPRELLGRLAPEARDTLLAHEFAHYRRRDHWVRVLEFVATGLYWWHPAVWMARAGIEAAEEECCDGWVVGGLVSSPRRYAEALLATVDFIAESRRPSLPPGACGAANRDARLLHRRLTGIMQADRPSQLRGVAAGVYAVVGACLLLQPVLRANTPPEVTELTPPAAPAPIVSGPRQVRCPTPKKPVEPPAWATAPAPGGLLTAVARDREVVLRGADGTVWALGPGKPTALAFAPGGNRLATAGPGTVVRVWDTRGSVLAVTHVPAAARAIAYTPDGSRLLVLDADHGITVCDPSTLDVLSRWVVEGPANSLSCAPDGQTVAVAFGSWLDRDTGWVECWSIPDRRRIAAYPATGPVGATRFSPDGLTLVIGSWDGSTAWRSLPDGELMAQRQLPKDLVAAAAFSPDAATLPLAPPPLPPAPEPVPVLSSIREPGGIVNRQAGVNDRERGILLPEQP